MDGFICRGYTFDNSSGKPVCLLHSEDTTSLGVSSLIDATKTIYRERELCLDCKLIERNHEYTNCHIFWYLQNIFRESILAILKIDFARMTHKYCNTLSTLYSFYVSLFFLSVRVQCNDSTMTIMLRTNDPFFGRIYSNGYADTCGVQGTGGNQTMLMLSIPTANKVHEGELHCGLNPAFSVDDRNRQVDNNFL